MIVFEAKLKGTDGQYRILDEVLRTARFVRNSCLRYWMDNPGKDKYDLNNYCTVLAKEYPWAKKLNSMARQASGTPYDLAGRYQSILFGRYRNTRVETLASFKRLH